MEQVTVNLGDRSYPIFIGSGLLTDSSKFAPYIQGRKVVVVSNETVAPLYLNTLTNTLSEFELDSVILPDGEQYKTLEYLKSDLRPTAGRIAR